GGPAAMPGLSKPTDARMRKRKAAQQNSLSSGSKAEGGPAAMPGLSKPTDARTRTRKAAH
ncbi:MAG: hypothetical protein K8S55_04280, partial [Phycisphaerae bacterium]|nr:hypothetical protein [Phycisphaerae bacterium]